MSNLMKSSVGLTKNQHSPAAHIKSVRTESIRDWRDCHYIQLEIARHDIKTVDTAFQWLGMIFLFFWKKNVIITVINGLWFSPYKRYFKLYNERKKVSKRKKPSIMEKQPLPSYHNGVQISTIPCRTKIWHVLFNKFINLIPSQLQIIMASK